MYYKKSFVFIMATITTLPKNINVANIEFAEMQVNEKYGSKNVFMSLGKSPIIIQTPRMNATFAMSKFVAGDKSKVVPTDAIEKFSVRLSIKDPASNASVGHFSNMLKKIDAAVVDAGVANCKTWFSKPKYAREVLSQLYSSQVIYPKNKETGEIIDTYPPMFNVPVMVQNGKIITECFNENKEKVQLSAIEKGSTVIAVMQCKGVWLGSSMFGVHWKTLCLRVIPPALGFKTFAFNDGDDEMEVVKVAAATDEASPDINIGNLGIVDKADKAAKVAVIEPESDEEDEDEDEEEDEEAPPPPPVKKIVASKKK